MATRGHHGKKKEESIMEFKEFFHNEKQEFEWLDVPKFFRDYLPDSMFRKQVGYTFDPVTKKATDKSCDLCQKNNTEKICTANRL